MIPRPGDAFHDWTSWEDIVVIWATTSSVAVRSVRLDLEASVRDVVIFSLEEWCTFLAGGRITEGSIFGLDGVDSRDPRPRVRALVLLFSLDSPTTRSMMQSKWGVAFVGVAH